MRLFIDCEFNEFGGDLISMALVAEDGREWYGELPCPAPRSWVAEHVIPLLTGPIFASTPDFQRSLFRFLADFDNIHVVADWPEDIAHFMRIVISGPGMRYDTPPLTCEVLRVDADSDVPHHALHDARGLRAHIVALTGDTP